MSHFCGLVVLTPKYLENHTLRDSLEKYDEGLKMPEYSTGEVSDFDKVRFIEYYTEQNGYDFKELRMKLYSDLLNEDRIKPFSEENDGDFDSYLIRLTYQNKENYAELFKDAFPGIFDDFAELYDRYGYSWNTNDWRFNPVNGKWQEYSTYNPNSKWDWYAEKHGRWEGAIKTKTGNFVDECLFGEIDWTDFKPEDYEDETRCGMWGNERLHLKRGVKWHYTKSETPFCLVIDGEWYEKGKMGYWGMAYDEMKEEDWTYSFNELLKDIPKDSKVYNIDFHI